MHSVLVTGGSRGIGLAIARKLVADGYRVFALARKTTDGLDAAIAATPSGIMNFVPFDLSQLEAIPELVREMKAEHGPLYGLVNNAAVGREGLLSNMHNSEIETLVRLNTLSPILLTKYVLRGMMTAGEGRIVNLASIIGFTGYSGLSVYGATKASMLGFTRSLAREVGRMDITVNAVAPGFIRTDMTSDLKENELVNLIPMRRFGLPEEVADAVGFFASSASSYITGEVLSINGGLYS